MIVDLLRDATESGARAAEKHAKSLARYTLWSAIATGALVLVTVVHVYFTVAAH